MNEDIPALRRACANGAFLNCKFGLYQNGQHILPQTEWELFNIFEIPLAELIDQLPTEYSKEIKEETKLYFIEALVECIDTEKCRFAITDQGYFVMSNNIKIRKSVKNKNPLREYHSQKIIENMFEQDYVTKRLFLINEANVYIPCNKIDQTEEQKKFIDSYEDLVKLCYTKNSSNKNKIYLCKNCGMVLKQDESGNFKCITKECNKKIDEREEINISQALIMNDFVAKCIYQPGILENNIRNILDKLKKSSIVLDYDIYPGENQSTYDTWDFRVKLVNEKVYLIDAKDHENVNYIIHDRIPHMEEGSKLLYVVPNKKPKNYLKRINEHFIKRKENIICIRLNELEKVLRKDIDI